MPSMYNCMYSPTPTHTHTHAHAHMHTHTRTHMHTCMHTHTCTHTRMHTHTCTCVDLYLTDRIMLCLYCQQTRAMVSWQWFASLCKANRVHNDNLVCIYCKACFPPIIFLIVLQTLVNLYRFHLILIYVHTYMHVFKFNYYSNVIAK